MKPFRRNERHPLHGPPRGEGEKCCWAQKETEPRGGAIVREDLQHCRDPTP